MWKYSGESFYLPFGLLEVCEVQSLKCNLFGERKKEPKSRRCTTETLGFSIRNKFDCTNLRINVE